MKMLDSEIVQLLQKSYESINHSPGRRLGVRRLLGESLGVVQSIVLGVDQAVVDRL